jgi:predicted nuclease of predicted toxin-antitoxin system
VNWLVDTQLPYQLASALKMRGHQAKHVSELPLGNFTPDAQIIAFAEDWEAVVVTKDGDFLAARALTGRPRRLLFVATGNIRNADLIMVLMHHLDGMTLALQESGLVELDRNGYAVR